MRFIKTQIKKIARLDRMYSVPERVLGNELFKAGVGLANRHCTEQWCRQDQKSGGAK